MTFSLTQERAGPARGQGPSRLARYEPLIFKCLGVLSALALWEAASDLGWASSTSISSPHRVAAAAITYIGSSNFLLDVETSGLEFLGGFCLAVVVGIVLGFATAWFRRLDYFLDPLINFLYASPRVAFGPLLIVWFGIGIGSKVAIIFLMAVFPIVINTAFGVRSVDRDLVALARSFNATDAQLLRTIVMPSSIPFIATGLRIAIGLAFIGVVVGEFIAATAGIGFSIQQAASNFDVDTVFVGIIIVGVAGVALTESLRHVEARLARWKTR